MSYMSLAILPSLIPNSIPNGNLIKNIKTELHDVLTEINEKKKEREREIKSKQMIIPNPTNSFQ